MDSAGSMDDEFITSDLCLGCELKLYKIAFSKIIPTRSDLLAKTLIELRKEEKNAQEELLAY
jgi:hypothetical protein